MFPQSVLVSGRMRQIVFVGQYLVAVPVAQDTACASWTRLAQPPALDSHARGPKTVSGGGRRGGGACVGGGPDPSAVQDSSISNTPATGQVFAADPAKLYAATPIYKKQVRPESRPCLALIPALSCLAFPVHQAGPSGPRRASVPLAHRPLAHRRYC